MGKKIIMVIILSILCSYGIEFTFSNDTIWEDNDSGFPIETQLINLSNDSLYIDSLVLIIDTIKFPEYEICWKAEKGIYQVWYQFGNRENGFPPINTYKTNYLLMRADSLDSLTLKYLSIDKLLSPKYFLNINDSIVPITAKIIFFSDEKQDTLIIRGWYNYDLTTLIINQKISIKIKNDYNTKNFFLYNCLGRRTLIKNSNKEKGNKANGVYIAPNTKYITILNKQKH